MSIFTVQIFKRILTGTKLWTNRYLVRATSIPEDLADITAIIEQEQNIHLGNVFFSHARISDLNPATDIYVTIPLNVFGLRTTSEWLPLFNTYRVDISVAGLGRPSRKFYRGPVPESAQADGILSTTIQDDISGRVQAMIAGQTTASAPLVDPDDQLWVTATCASQVNMRQLTRKRKKKVVGP